MKKKKDKIWIFNIVHFPNFEISTSPYLAPPSNKRHTLKFQNLINAGALIKRNIAIKDVNFIFRLLKKTKTHRKSKLSFVQDVVHFVVQFSAVLWISVCSFI